MVTYANLSLLACGKLIFPRARYVILLGPCSRHRKLYISEIFSDQGQISPKQVISLETSSPTKVFGICNLFLRRQHEARNDYHSSRNHYISNFSQEPNAELEPPEPFSRNRNRNRNRPLCWIVLKHRTTPFLRGTAGTENRNRSNRSIPKP